MARTSLLAPFGSSASGDDGSNATSFGASLCLRSQKEMGAMG